jgi:hypothetical protein
VHNDNIAKYVAERQRHASRQRLGHRDASLLAWRGVHIGDAGLSKHVPVAIEAPPDGNLRPQRRYVAQRVPQAVTAMRTSRAWWWGGRGGAILRGDSAHDSAERMRRSSARNIPLGTPKKGHF